MIALIINISKCITWFDKKSHYVFKISAKIEFYKIWQTIFIYMVTAKFLNFKIAALCIPNAMSEIS